MPHIERRVIGDRTFEVEARVSTVHLWIGDVWTITSPISVSEVIDAWDFGRGELKRNTPRTVIVDSPLGVLATVSISQDEMLVKAGRDDWTITQRRDTWAIGSDVTISTSPASKRRKRRITDDVWRIENSGAPLPLAVALGSWHYLLGPLDKWKGDRTWDSYPGVVY